MSCFRRNVHFEFRGETRDYLKRRAEQKYTTPHEIVRRALNLLATVDDPDADMVLVDRFTGKTLQRFRLP